MKKFIAPLCLATLIFASPESYSYEIKECSSVECQSNFKNFKKYARKEIPQAMEVLANFYLKGYGTDKNEVKALKLYVKSAKYGSPTAQLKAGMMYISGWGKKDIKKGVTWLQWASNNNVNEASHYLATLYLEGDLVEQDIDKAQTLLEKAASKSHFESQYLLGRLHESGHFGKINKEKAIELFQSSAFKVSKSKDRLLALNIAIRSEPTSDMEVIEVNPEPYQDFLNSTLASFKNRPPAGGATGSSLDNMGCKQQKSNCSFMIDPDDIKRFMRSWQSFGDRALTSRLKPTDL